MIANLSDYESTAQRCLDLIARHAPRLMREGGGALSKEPCERIKAVRMSEEQKQAALSLMRTGLYSGTVIARKLGLTQSAVCKLAERSKIKLPDGRTLAVLRKAAA